MKVLGVQLMDYTYVFFPTTSTYELPLEGLSPGNYTVIVSLTDYSGKTLTYQLPLRVKPSPTNTLGTTSLIVLIVLVILVAIALAKRRR
jgi:hypothetical protein